MNALDFESLADTARDLVQRQLTRFSLKLNDLSLNPEETRALLSMAKWLSEMALIEKDEIANMSPKDLINMKQRLRRIRRLAKNEHPSKAQGDSKAAGKIAEAQSADRPETDPL